ncbi:MAG: hypothetical protein DRQ44_04360 [Gammaproteobacteria bacterium]|nr:MAG: hypothetical protein DRQ44_04360 [Gammaproteobacteria bacterium]
MSITIETHNLTRRFGDFVVVKQLNLSINSGEIFGLLGPNVAGKSTIIRFLAGILRPGSGEALCRITYRVVVHIELRLDKYSLQR